MHEHQSFSQFIKIKFRKKSMATYFIHDNGARPFKCVIDNKTIDIFEWVDDSYTPTPILSFEPLNIFIGKSPRNKWTQDLETYGPEFDGNTILISIQKGEYIYIGSSIFSFRTRSPIVQYVSILGNNDVPYPYATDEHGFVCLLLELVVLHPRKELKEYDNVYEYYYEWKLITDDKGFIPPVPPKPYHTIPTITTFYIDHDPYTLDYEPIPIPFEQHHIKGRRFICVNNAKKRVTFPDYVKMMEMFGKERGFEPLLCVRQYAARHI